MHPQLTAIVRELESAQSRLHRLAASTPEERWARRAARDRWSVAECVAHLNLTSRAYLPRIGAALGEARTLGVPAPRRYRRDAVGWLIARMSGPLPRVGRWRFGRVRTPAAFVPGGDLMRHEVVGEFEALQGKLITLITAADGLPIDRVRVRSPFDARARYNLYACLTLLAPHQHRHLEQAEEVWEASPAPQVTPA